jgi:hypothetical protein
LWFRRFFASQEASALDACAIRKRGDQRRHPFRRLLAAKGKRMEQARASGVYSHTEGWMVAAAISHLLLLF